jgi:hypothetical protein
MRHHLTWKALLTLASVACREAVSPPRPRRVSSRRSPSAPTWRPFSTSTASLPPQGRDGPDAADKLQRAPALGARHSQRAGTAVALQFTNEPVRQIAITAQSGSNAIDIPPGEAHWELTGKPFVFEDDSHILSFTPRMNERGKRFRYYLVYPGGRRTMLLNVYKWRYDWVSP